jgi:hypothetical protein
MSPARAIPAPASNPENFWDCNAHVNRRRASLTVRPASRRQPGPPRTPNANIRLRIAGRSGRVLRRDSSYHTGDMPVFPRRFYARYFGPVRDASLPGFRSISSPMTPVSPLNGGIALTGKRGRKTPKLSAASARKTTTNTAAHFM